MGLAAVFILIGIAMLPLFVSFSILIRSHISRSPDDTGSIHKPSVNFEKFRKTKWFYLSLSFYCVLILAATFGILNEFKDALNLSIVTLILFFTWFAALMAGIFIWQVNKTRKLLKKHPRPDAASSYKTWSDWQTEFLNAYADEYGKNIWRDIAIIVTVALFSMAFLFLIVYLLQL